MPDPKQKLVKVDDDIIAFPDHLEDEHVSRLIKSFREKKNQATELPSNEQSEHARQLHPERPFYTPSQLHTVNDLTRIEPILSRDSLAKKAATFVGDIGAAGMGVVLHPAQTVGGAIGSFMPGSPVPNPIEGIYQGLNTQPAETIASGIGQAAVFDAAFESPEVVKGTYEAIKSPLAQHIWADIKRLPHDESGFVQIPGKNGNTVTVKSKDILNTVAEHTETINALRARLTHSTPEQVKALRDAIEATGRAAAEAGSREQATTAAHADLALSHLLDDVIEKTQHLKRPAPVTVPVDPGWVKRMSASLLSELAPKITPAVEPPAVPQTVPAKPLSLAEIKRVRAQAEALNPVKNGESVIPKVRPTVPGSKSAEVLRGTTAPVAPEANQKKVPVPTLAELKIKAEKLRLDKPIPDSGLGKPDMPVDPVALPNPPDRIAAREALQKARDAYSVMRPETVYAYEEALENYKLTTKVGMDQFIKEQMGQIVKPGDVHDIEELDRMLALPRMPAEPLSGKSPGPATEFLENEKKEPKETKYKYGNTQADVPADSEAGQALAAARGQIDQNDLMPSSNTSSGGGLEDQAHITVRYGIDGEDHEGIKKYLESQAPFEATLGKTTAFPPSDHSDGAAPIVVSVESPDLRRMEQEIDAHGDFVERSFPDYKPHVTLGYVKPEAAEKYVGMKDLQGKKFTIDSVSISKKDGSTEAVQLKGSQSLSDKGVGATQEHFKAATGKDITEEQAAKDVENNQAQKDQVIEELYRLHPEMALDYAQRDPGARNVLERVLAKHASKGDGDARTEGHSGVSDRGPGDAPGSPEGRVRDAASSGELQRDPASSEPELHGGSSEGITPVDPEASLKYKAADANQPFYLKSERILADKMRGPMPASDIQKMLLANGVKPEEMKYTGLDDFLRDKGSDKVTPEEIKDFVDTHDLQVEEVLKGDEKERKSLAETSQELFGKPYSELEMWQRHEAYAKAFPEGYKGYEPTKHGSYTMPGGQNYRELLVTLPAIGRDATYEKLASAYKAAEKDSYDYMESHPISLANPDPEMQNRYHRVAIAKEALDKYKATKDKESPGGVFRPGANDFTHSHWDGTPNVVGHIRFNERTGPNGERIMHLEEMQSDWHQQGRKKGYNPTPERTAELEETRKRVEDLGRNATPAQKQEWVDAMNELQPNNTVRAPDAPFKKTWHELLLKRAIRYAADNGFDGVSWTSGVEQVGRYPDDLRKSVDRITWTEAHGETKEKFVRAFKDGEIVFKGTVDADGKFRDYKAAGKEVDQVLGKAMGRRIMEENGGDIEGKDFTVGGEGMKGFYDKIIPDAANKLGKKFGTKVGETKVETGKYPLSEEWKPEEAKILHRGDQYQVWAPNRNGVNQFQSHFASEEEAKKFIADHEPGYKEPKTVPYLPITPEMRAAGPDSLFHLVYKSPAADPSLISTARSSLESVEAELEKNPPPLEPVDGRTPQAMKEWKARHKEWLKTAQPLLDKYSTLSKALNHLENHDVGQIRQMPNGKKVLYMKRSGMRGLHIGFGGETDVDNYVLGGVSISAEDIPHIQKNLFYLRPEFWDEIGKLLRDAKDENGRVTVAAIPEKGESIRDALARLREELNHGWQKDFADAVGNHLPDGDFSELNDAMPQGFQSHLLVNYPELRNFEGDGHVIKKRVLEATAHLMSEAPSKFGVSEDEAAAYLFQYFHAVEETHGDKALEQLVHITTTAKRIKEDYFNARGKNSGPEGGGSVRGVQSEGHGGDKDTAPQEERGGAQAGSGKERVNAPEFKKWFDGSKVVDESGRPLVMYHGSPKTFSEFKDMPTRKGHIASLGDGHYFTSDRVTAENFTSGKTGPTKTGKLYEVYLSIQNPFSVETADPERIVQAIKEVRAENGKDELPQRVLDSYAKDIKEIQEDAAQNKPLHNEFTGLDKLLSLFSKDILQRAGYDGIAFHANGKHPFNEVVVFDSKKIKSATDNVGTYDPTKADITMNQKARPLPEMPPIPQEGQFPAVQTDDGSIYVDTENNGTHVKFIDKSGIPPERVTSGGWIKDGVYDGTDRSDAVHYAERVKAQLNVAGKRKSLSELKARAKELAPTGR